MVELDDDIQKMYELVLASAKTILVSCATISLINSSLEKGDELLESVVKSLRTQWEKDKPSVQEDIDNTRGKSNEEKSKIVLFDDGFSKGKGKLH